MRSTWLTYSEREHAGRVTDFGNHLHPHESTEWDKPWAQILVVLFGVFTLGRYPFALEVGGVSVHLWRITLLVIAILALGPERHARARQSPLFFLFVAGSWLGWALLSFAWTPSLVSGLVEVSGLATGLLLTFTIGTTASLTRRTMTALVLSWSLAVGTVATIGLTEYVTGTHLPSPFATQSALAAPGRQFVTGTLGNSNDFASFLLTGLPFAVVGVSLTRRPSTRVVAIGSIALAALMIFLSNSRLSTLGLAIGFIGYFTMKKSTASGRVYRFRLSHAGAFLALAVVILASPGMLAKFKNLASEWSQGGSLRDRLLLIEHGLGAVFNTHFLGLGAGGFEPSVRSLPGPLTSSGDVNPHSFVIELLSQYGLVIFLVFTAWFTSLAIRLSTSRKLVAARNGDDFSIRIATAAMVSVLIFIPASSDPSSFIEQGTGWLALGSMLAVSQYLRQASATTPD